jgi:hypothetical protein
VVDEIYVLRSNELINLPPTWWQRLLGMRFWWWRHA